MSTVEAQEVLELLRTGFPPATSIQQGRANLERLYAQFPPHPSVLFQPQDLNGVPSLCALAPNVDSRRKILFLHGGGWSAGTSKGHGDLMGRLSQASGSAVLGLDYRLAPEFPFPAAIEDGVAAYKWLLDLGYKPTEIAFCGCSAGGGLVFSILLAAKKRGLAMPASAVAMCPCVDLFLTGESLQANSGKDWIQKERLEATVSTYLAGNDPSSPLASPLLADLSELPPTLLQVGTHELLLDDSRRLAQKIIASSGRVQLSEWPGMFHIWQVFASRLTEGAEAIQEAGQFLAQRFSVHK
jgi:epsilon-lactone hydrolase